MWFDDDQLQELFFEREREKGDIWWKDLKKKKKGDERFF